jgi:anaerobic magnesium-protoporphyrin IX monomethyl ester cyclase
MAESADHAPLATRSAFPNQHRASRPVMLIGFQEQANLGLGYLAATLRREGHAVQVFDFEADREQILNAAKALDPILIGFSLIFQFYVDRFSTLIRYLRKNGIACHFTMGGHFPSLSYQHTIKLIPELDSVVRFEGEATLLEMVNRLASEGDWREVAGIAYHDGESVVATALRPLVPDLDSLPYPDRDACRGTTTILGRRAVPMLASRGCIRTCSFCSIHVFYRVAPGKVVRTRKPALVVEEMRLLYEKDGVTIFSFQDDDFPLYGVVWQRWARDFVSELHRNRLPGRIIWKINCRADAVDPVLFSEMREAGLISVYMGLESGSEQGLNTLHKQITVEQNLRAVAILKKLGIMFEFGFMLFDPSTTFESVADNLNFLRTIVGDGSAAATFCRMVPYDGTPIKDELARSNRLRGDICHPDYDFLDPRIDGFFQAINRMVHVSGWIHGIGSLTVQLQHVKAELAVMEALFPPLPGLASYRATVRRITSSANEVLFRVVDDVLHEYRDGRPHPWTPQRVKGACEGLQEELLGERNSFVSDNQAILMRALQDSASGLSAAESELDTNSARVIASIQPESADILSSPD